MFHKCPNCGYEEPAKPYEYGGYLRAFLPDILKLLREGKGPYEAAAALPDGETHDGYPYRNPGMIAYIGRRYGIPPRHGHSVSQRNAEMVERYRAGGITYVKLAEEYGISAARVRQIVMKIEQRAEVEGKRQQQASAIEDMPIRLAELPTRVVNCLVNEGYETIGDAMKLKEHELLRIANFGRSSLEAWKRFINP